jgi:DNA-binding FadR family transcriptional regulator
MQAAEAGADDPLESDIAFHVAILEASANPFFIQFRDVVSTALHTSIRFTNRFKGRTASLPAHRAVLTAIEAKEPDAAYAAMAGIVDEVMVLITEAERSEASA